MILKRTMRYRSLWVGTAPGLCLALFLFAGCNSGTGTPVATITSLGGFTAGLAQAFCARQACCGSAQPQDAAVAAPDAGSTTAGSCSADGGTPPNPASGADAGSSCEARAAVAIAQQLALVSTAVAEGLLAINPSAATSCIASYQGRPCTGTQTAAPDVQDALSGCGGLFTGYIPVGERCDMTPECLSGLYCLSQGTGQNLSSIAGSGSLGVCFPYQKLDQPCNTSSDCDPTAGLACDAVSFTCGAPSSLGADGGAD
jgi:hypothetical protein